MDAVRSMPAGAIIPSPSAIQTAIRLYKFALADR